MKNTFTLLIIALLAIGCDLSNKSGSELSNDNQIIIGQIDSRKSDIL
jgi:hypothetical protein